MQKEAKITSKGQVTVPREVRYLVDRRQWYSIYIFSIPSIVSLGGYGFRV